MNFHFTFLKNTLVMNFLFNFGLVNAPVIAAFLSAFVPLKYLGLKAYIKIFELLTYALDDEEEVENEKDLFARDIQITLNVQGYLSKQTSHVTRAGLLLFLFGMLCNAGMCICAFCNVKDSLPLDGARMIVIPFCSLILYAYNTMKIFRMRNFVEDLGKSIFPSSRISDICRGIPFKSLSLMLLMGLAAFLFLMVTLSFKFIVKYNLPIL